MIQRRLGQELRKIEVEINEEKTKVVDFDDGGSFGWRKQHEQRKVSQADLLSYPDSSVGPGQGSTTTPRWMYVVGIHAIGLILLFVALHLTGGGLRSH